MRNTSALITLLRAGAIGTVLACSTAACASAQVAQRDNTAYDEAYDPLETVNRGIFEFNRGADFWVIRPVATLYRDVVPLVARDMVRNFLNNLRAPLNAANALLQGDPDRAGAALGRFSANTFIGVFGLFDVVPEVPQVNEDFGQTLAVWGLGEGPFLMLPLFGPSTLRDTGGIAVDYFADPINMAAGNSGADWVPPARTGTRGIDARSRNIETLDEIERTSIDYYATIRSLYRQQRNDEIRNGRPGAMTPDISLQFDDERRMASRSGTALR